MSCRGFVDWSLMSNWSLELDEIADKQSNNNGKEKVCLLVFVHGKSCKILEPVWECDARTSMLIISLNVVMLPLSH